MKSEIREILLASVKKNYKKKSLDFDISRTKTKSHGNWSSNVALILGKELKQQPKIIAENLVKNLPKKKWLEKVEIAGPGFVNFFLTEEAQSFFLKNFLTLLKFFGFIIKQKPTPQLKVLSISPSLILFFLSQLKILRGFILSKYISAHKLLGITLPILSANPPPVILAQPFNKFLFTRFKISFT